MKSRHTLVITVVSIFLGGCLGRDYQTRSIVHDDGKIEREIIMKSADSALLKQNLFGASADDGWDVKVQGPDSVLLITFSRVFESDSAANNVMFYRPDTLVNIKSDFQDEFGWLYSTIRYTDTFVSGIKFKKLSPDGFFTEDDYAFMKYYSQSNKKSKEDSIRRTSLDAKVEQYFIRGIFEDTFDHILDVCKREELDKRWIDTLVAHKEHLFKHMSAAEDKMKDPRSLLVDTLKIPFKESSENLGVETDKYFLTLFDSFSHTIVMPGKIVTSNADSVNGKYAYWRIGDDHLLHDYTMAAESRKLNIWPSLGVLALIAGAWIVRKSRRSKVY